MNWRPEAIIREKVNLIDKQVKKLEEAMDNKYLELLKQNAVLTKSK